MMKKFSRNAGPIKIMARATTLCITANMRPGSAGWVEKRREHADRFNKAFAELPALRLTVPPAEIYHSYYKYYMFVRPEMLKSDWSRDRIMEGAGAAVRFILRRRLICTGRWILRLRAE